MLRKSKGSLLDFMTVCISLLAMVLVVMVYLNLSELMLTKLEVSQVTRKYILRMETKGYLDEGDKSALLSELASLGMREIELGGSTLSPVGYGENICLSVKGMVTGRVLNSEDSWLNGFVQREFMVEENRMSTAKN
ncbi:MAG: hypothetical protein IJZ82_10135 [Lachnospiraceae bacterium]|nr:hypothetical protein [Lachnospiraceae bacterium]